MPPKRLSSTPTIHEPMPLPKQQQKFTNRRKSVKRSTPLPQLIRSQSTLTQLDFPTPNSSSRVIPISSDDDEEYTEARSGTAKRKRKGKFDKREADQSSMTQFGRGDMSGFPKRRKTSVMLNDQYSIWEDYEPEKWEAELNENQRQRAAAMLWLQNDEDDSENQLYAPEIPETSQVPVKSSPRADSGVEMNMEDKSTKFHTPRKVRFKTEVPSSQTPPSTNHSIRILSRDANAERSTLKERSINIQPDSPHRCSAKSSQTNSTVPKETSVLESAISIEHATASTTSPEKVRCSQEDNTAYAPMPSVYQHSQLSRMTTIQDSQVQPQRPQPQRFARKTTIEDSQVDDVEPLSLFQDPSAEQKRPSKLVRVTTVQDSERSDDGDIELTTQSHENDACEYGDHDGVEDDEFGNVQIDDEQIDDDEFVAEERSQFHGLQSTYDPAFSALDRDAERFAWTQTQRPAGGIPEDDETDEEDLDVGCMRRSLSAKAHTLQLGDNSPTAIEHQDREKADLPTDRTAQLAKPLGSRVDKAPKDLALDQQSSNEDVEVPSSPPPLLPSQGTTVVPTQWSQRFQDFQDSPDDDHAEVKIEPDQSQAIVPGSPYDSLFAVPEMSSSSPLPMAPTSLIEKYGLAAEHEPSPGHAPPSTNISSTALEDLLDFSLPPPPPLSSARSAR